MIKKYFYYKYMLIWKKSKLMYYLPTSLSMAALQCILNCLALICQRLKNIDHINVKKNVYNIMSDFCPRGVFRGGQKKHFPPPKKNNWFFPSSASVWFCSNPPPHPPIYATARFVHTCKLLFYGSQQGRICLMNFTF